MMHEIMMHVIMMHVIVGIIGIVRQYNASARMPVFAHATLHACWKHWPCVEQRLCLRHTIQFSALAGVYASKSFKIDDGRQLMLSWLVETSVGCTEQCTKGTAFTNASVSKVPPVHSQGAVTPELLAKCS